MKIKNDLARKSIQQLVSSRNTINISSDGILQYNKDNTKRFNTINKGGDGGASRL